MGSRGASKRRGKTLTGFATEIGPSAVSTFESMDSWIPFVRGGSAGGSSLGMRGRGRGGPLVGLGRLGATSDGWTLAAEGGTEAPGSVEIGTAADGARDAAGDGGSTCAGASGDGGGGGGAAAARWRKPSGNGMPDSRGRGRRSFDPAAELPFSRVSGGGGRPLPPGARPGFLPAGDSVFGSPSLGVEELTGRLSGSVSGPKRNLAYRSASRTMGR